MLLYIYITCLTPVPTVLMSYTVYYMREIRNQTHIIWVDNFSKFLSRSVPNMAAGVYSSCLWTGVAAFKCSSDFDMSIKHDDEGVVIAAMLDDPFVYSQSVKRGLQYTMQTCRSYYSQSLVKKYDIRNIPPKIDTRRWPDMKEVVDIPYNSTRCVHPAKFVEQNIGSNQGLIACDRDRGGYTRSTICTPTVVMITCLSMLTRIYTGEY